MLSHGETVIIWAELTGTLISTCHFKILFHDSLDINSEVPVVSGSIGLFISPQIIHSSNIFSIFQSISNHKILSTCISI
jgi:hypothetical protein